MKRIRWQDDREKLAFMRRKAIEASTDRELVRIADQLVQPFRADDFAAQANEIHRWVRDGVTYRRDPNRREQIAHPLVSIARGAGDCDDKTIVPVSLCRALGIEADIWPIWAGDFLRHVQWCARWPGTERDPRARSSAELDGPPGAGWLVGDPTIAGAELGQDPYSVPVNPDTGKLPLA